MRDASPNSDAVQNRRAVGWWLVICAVCVVVMMVIGAITRLTGSGLSMVEWRPLLGWLPPLSDAEWQRVFALYRETGQYRLGGAVTTLADFKAIFWWEYIHRLWGRVMGLVFAGPLAWFWATRRLPAGCGGWMVALLCLGAMQGVIGWWMVTSGLVDRVSVSPLRLAAHLAMALLLLGLLIHLAMRMLAPAHVGARAPAEVRWLAWGALACISATAVMGALVAGQQGGLIHNDWPLMGGALVPDGLWRQEPWWANLHQTPQTAQFIHRLMAYATVACAGALWWRATRWSRQSPGANARAARRMAGALAAAVLGQATLGILTLLLFVPTALAAVHQAGAAACLALAVAALAAISGKQRS